ncbi:MAG: hypothetical protein NWS20_01530, partial [Rickettsiaceae bacterium]|nr:hypothetical protein [Rickettsiaceae bacterium]MDP4832809.1 hypothetical protein [Rickettsiaceae bacterium]
SLNGKIDDNYQIPPGIRITLEAGTTFKGIDVGGQVLYNNEYIVKVFSLNQAKELQLIPRELMQEEFLTYGEELEPLSPAMPTLHRTLTPPPKKIESSAETAESPIILHTLPKEGSSIQLLGQEAEPAAETSVESHSCGCIIL